MINETYFDKYKNKNNAIRVGSLLQYIYLLYCKAIFSFLNRIHSFRSKSDLKIIVSDLVKHYPRNKTDLMKLKSIL